MGHYASEINGAPFITRTQIHDPDRARLFLELHKLSYTTVTSVESCYITDEPSRRYIEIKYKMFYRIEEISCFTRASFEEWNAIEV